MKIFKEKIFLGLLTMLLVTVVGMFASTRAHAYTSGQADPINNDGEREYRAVKKSETALFSDAIVAGDILVYDTVNNNDGYTVTRVGANNVTTTARIACVAVKAIATGNIGLNRCLSKGYFQNTAFSATGIGIAIGQKLCVNSTGQGVPCAACDNAGGVNDCRYGNATENSPITAFSAGAPSTSGTTLDVYINSK